MIAGSKSMDLRQEARRLIEEGLTAAPIGARVNRANLATWVMESLNLSRRRATRLVRAAIADIQRAGRPFVSDGRGFFRAESMEDVLSACAILESAALSQLDRAAGLRGKSLVHLLQMLMPAAKFMDQRRALANVRTLLLSGKDGSDE